jgi:hypothetical protein
MHQSAKKCLLRQITNNELPMPHKFIFVDEDNDKQTIEIIGHVIYVEFTITPTECNLLKNNYTTQVYFWISDDYPFSSPIIMLEDAVTHELVDSVEVNTCDYCPLFTFPQLVMNTYCIILESLCNGQNNDLIEYINKKIDIENS